VPAPAGKNTGQKYYSRINIRGMLPVGARDQTPQAIDVAVLLYKLGMKQTRQYKDGAHKRNNT
jgi:hypothetical protein